MHQQHVVLGGGCGTGRTQPLDAAAKVDLFLLLLLADAAQRPQDAWRSACFLHAAHQVNGHATNRVHLMVLFMFAL